MGGGFAVGARAGRVVCGAGAVAGYRVLVPASAA